MIMVTKKPSPLIWNHSPFIWKKSTLIWNNSPLIWNNSPLIWNNSPSIPKLPLLWATTLRQGRRGGAQRGDNAFRDDECDINVCDDDGNDDNDDDGDDDDDDCVDVQQCLSKDHAAMAGSGYSLNIDQDDDDCVNDDCDEMILMMTMVRWYAAPMRQSCGQQRV